MQGTIDSAISVFDTISLSQMDNVKLMDRMDKKYSFSIFLLPQFLDALKPFYRVLEVNHCRRIHYESVYFDTPDFSLFRRHQCGKMNRYKVRFRKYVESDLTFFEIKYKNNKNRTIKNRIHHDGLADFISGDAEKYLDSKTSLDPKSMESKVKVHFNRITLVHKTAPERVTIDSDLRFSNHSREENFENLVIAEVKQEKSNRSEFVRLMKENHISEGSISKYCFAVSTLFNEVKKNTFKERLLKFQKLNHDTVTGN